MNISMIAAMAKNRVIGLDNNIPWYLPDDLKFFKFHTTGKPIIMGRKTFESIGSRALPNRLNIVISSNTALTFPSVQVFSSVNAALGTLQGVEEVVIIGGGRLYKQMLPQADRLYLTLIDVELSGDTVFPDWSVFQWNEISRERHDKDDCHAYNFEFVILEKL